MWIAWICLAGRMVVSVDYSYSNMEEAGKGEENLEVVVEVVE